MLQVRVIAKYKDKKGILVGYMIQEEGTTKSMQVTKESLKAAIRNKQCEVVNMTMTSDGRLIGHAAPVKNNKKAVAKKTQRAMGECLIQVYTSAGKPILGVVLVCEERAIQSQFQTSDVKAAIASLKNMVNKTQVLVLRDELQQKIQGGHYINIKHESGAKVSLAQCGVVSKKFETQVKGLTELIANNGGISGLDISNIDKTTYNVALKLNTNNVQVVKAAIALVCNAAIEDKIRVEGYSVENATVQIKCLTGIKDLRKAMKKVPVNKA